MKIGVLLSGCGVYDGSEIHEAVFTLLAIDENKAEAVCFAPDIEQHHVINHQNGEEMEDRRNVLIESARIARGNIGSLAGITSEDIDALVIPGGFGAAKNLSKWAFEGPDGDILPDVKRIINEMVAKGKPVAGLCMGPTVIAKALEDSGIKASLTVGTTEAPSSYEIEGISAGMEKAGATAVMKTVEEIEVDLVNRIVSAPCYMMDATVTQIRNNIKDAIDKLVQLGK